MPAARTRPALLLITAIAVSISMTGCSAIGQVVSRNLDEVFGRGSSDSSSPDGNPAGTVSDDGNTYVDELAIGDCLDDEDVSLDTSITEVLTLDVVPCDSAHDSEVYGFSEYDDGDFPSDSVLDEAAYDGCLALFEPYVGRSYESSSLDIAYYVPTLESWKYGDREATCVLYDIDLDSLTGSAEGAGL